MEETGGDEGKGGGGERETSLGTTPPPRISLIPNESFGLDEDATEREREGEGGQTDDDVSDDVDDDVTPSLRDSISSSPR